MRDTFVYVWEGEMFREKKKRELLGANAQKNRANRGHSLKPNLSSFSVYNNVLMKCDRVSPWELFMINPQHSRTLCGHTTFLQQAGC